MSEEDGVIKCQSCFVPLEVDSSLLDLSLAQRNLLLNAKTEVPNSGFKIPTERLERLSLIQNPNELNLRRSTTNNSNSYVFLNGDSSLLHQAGPEITSNEEDSKNDWSTKTLSSRINTITNIFNILSFKSNIDHPVCQECCDMMIQKLKADYEEAMFERDKYAEFLSRLQKQEDVERSQAVTKDSNCDSREMVEKEHTELLKELIQLEDQESQLDLKIEDLEAKLAAKKKAQLQLMKERNIKELNNLEFSKEIESLKSKYERTLTNLDTLRKTNIFNETFRISHDGPFGTINELRLGSLEDTRVTWQEINAALGQLILLLATICTRLQFKLDGFVLRPMGSLSKIEQFEASSQSWTTHDAFNNNSFKIGRLFHKETSFDKAMQSLLVIVSQIASCLSATSFREPDELELPYSITADKINGMSIKLFGNNPTMEWTTACKFLLTNSKWLLAFSSSLMSARR
ncbi:LAMI_0C10242g1_1 [Lachancea mirantina]|uniref:LAMI_0C10242g1_1 n=1 Tax=Lachancea mirantina TaxID=1230905 RepID=A0A1G4J687_9SACH|nr:LAMI_0C10242g1_1 [Lachancea mirantina]